MSCPKCGGRTSKKSYVRPSEVFRLGPGYFNASRTAEYYTESVWTCDKCGYREVKWNYSHTAKTRRVAVRA